MLKSKKFLILGIIGVIAVLFIFHYVRIQYKIDNLNEAIRNEDYQSIDKILTKLSGKEMNKYSTHASYHPLSMACFYGQEQTIKKLIEHGADVNYREKLTQDTPLTVALYSDSPNRYKVANILIEKGADVNAVNKYGFSALTQVFKFSDKETMSESLELFKYLYKTADVENCLKEEPSNVKDIMEFAVNNDRADAVDWLIKAEGFKYSDIPSLDGSKLHYAYNLDNNNHLSKGLKMVEYIVKNNLEDINIQDKEGRTLLMTASRAQDEEACKLFLSLGVDRTVKDNNGQTAADLTENNNIKKIIG